MRKTKEAIQPSVKIRLRCVHSGAGQSWSVGDVIEVTTEEAQRLADHGAAEILAPEV